MSEKYVVVATFALPLEAHVAYGRLCAEGIPAHVTGDGTPSAFAGFGAVGGRVELYVPESAWERALDILAECMPGEQWRVMLNKDMQPAEAPASGWTSDERIKPGGEFEGERDSRLWVCSLCGDAIPSEETVCPSCGTARDALRSTKAEPRREKRSPQRASATDVQKGQTGSSGPSVDTDFEAPEVEEYPQGDVLAGRALTAAVVAVLSVPLALFIGSWLGGVVNGVFFLIALYYLVRLMLFSGELSPRATRKSNLALVLDVLLFGYKLFFFWFNSMR